MWEINHFSYVTDLTRRGGGVGGPGGAHLIMILRLGSVHPFLNPALSLIDWFVSSRPPTGPPNERLRPTHWSAVRCCRARSFPLLWKTLLSMLWVVLLLFEFVNCIRKSVKPNSYGNMWFKIVAAVAIAADSDFMSVLVLQFAASPTVNFLSTSKVWEALIKISKVLKNTEKQFFYFFINTHYKPPKYHSQGRLTFKFVKFWYSIFKPIL